MSQTQTPTSEFERTQSVLHLPANYEAALLEATEPGQIALRGYINWVADFERSGLSYSQFAAQRAQIIGDTFSDTSRRVAGLMRTIPEVVEGLRDLSAQDRTAYATLRKDYSTFPSSSRTDAKNRASSPNAYQAMHIGIDDLTYAQLRKDYSTFPTSSREDARERASGDATYHKMEEELYREYPSAGRQRFSSGGNRQNEGHQQHTGSGHRQQRSHSSAGGQSRPRAEKARTRQSTAYDELMTTLRHGADRGLVSTIESFDRAEVAKVIATVKFMREVNPEVTDKQIALKYNRLSNNSEKTTPERQRATQIVMALMGGSINGQLPF